MDRFELRWQDYSLAAEQQALRSAFRDFCQAECPASVVRAAEPLGHDESMWAKLIGLGAVSMGLSARDGGDDAGLAELTLVAEELGRVAAPVPFVSQVVTARLLASLGADQLVHRICSGEPVALAYEPALPGRAQLVPDAALARDVIAVRGEQVVCFSAQSPARHVLNQGCTPLAWWRPDDADDAVVLARGAASMSAYHTAAEQARLLLAACLVGLTESALRLAVDFVKTRQTMGVAVGALQGVAFPLADVATGIAAARHLVWRAAWLADHESAQGRHLPASAYWYANHVATSGTSACAHMQGGLGFTVEADASLFFLRAKGWGVLAGDPAAGLPGIAQSRFGAGAA